MLWPQLTCILKFDYSPWWYVVLWSTCGASRLGVGCVTFIWLKSVATMDRWSIWSLTGNIMLNMTWYMMCDDKYADQYNKMRIIDDSQYMIYILCLYNMNNTYDQYLWSIWCWIWWSESEGVCKCQVGPRLPINCFPARSLNTHNMIIGFDHRHGQPDHNHDYHDNYHYRNVCEDGHQQRYHKYCNSANMNSHCDHDTKKKAALGDGDV